ncbi:MAG: hypothetical protein IIA85_02800 [Nanoarchaeota archaeon]|nr:hypothetical protein [Nanoarchaeota archaeon]
MKFINLLLILLFFYFFSIASVSALSVVVHVPEKYTDVQAGERFYFEIEVKYPENPSRKDLRLNYEISKDNEIIAQSKVLKAIETQASFIDFIVIPKSAETGLHLIKIKISDYEALSEEVSASFHVVSGGGKIKIYFFILLGATVLVGILVIINIVLGRRG